MTMAPCTFWGMFLKTGVKKSSTNMTTKALTIPANWDLAPLVSMTAEREKEPVVV